MSLWAAAEVLSVFLPCGQLPLGCQSQNGVSCGTWGAPTQTGTVHCKGGTALGLGVHVGLQVLNVFLIMWNISLTIENFSCFSNKEENRGIVGGNLFKEKEVVVIKYLLSDGENNTASVQPVIQVSYLRPSLAA